MLTPEQNDAIFGPSIRVFRIKGHRVPGEDSVRIVLGVDFGTAVNIGGVKIDGIASRKRASAAAILFWQRNPGFYVSIRRCH
jgi:hypothetical protein